MQPIFHAILQNDLSAFLGLVEERASSLDDRSEEQNTNNTVLHMAAKLGHQELVSKIIELRPDLLCSRNAHGDTPLHLAALLGDVNIVTQMLDSGLELCSARNNKNQTPLHLASLSIFMEAARLIVEKTYSVDLDELNFALSSGSTCIVGIIVERFPQLARKRAWVVEGCSPSTLLHHACDKGDIELTSILLGVGHRLEEALNTEGFSPLHLAVRRGSVLILKEFVLKAPFSFEILTPSKETVFHLAARNKTIDAFVFMAESLGINTRIHMKKKDQHDNTVLHIAASVACCAPLIRYIVDKKLINIRARNKTGHRASDLVPLDAKDFEFISSCLRCDDTKTSEELDSEKAENNQYYRGRSNYPLHNTQRRSHEKKVIQLLELIGTSISEIGGRRQKSKKHKVKNVRKSLEHEMHIEALQNARNTIAIVAVLIASVSYAGGINPPGGVYQDGPWRGKAIAGFMATAYVAASWVTIPHLPGTRWLFPAMVSVAGGSLTVLFSYLGVETIGHWFKKMNRVSFNKNDSRVRDIDDDPVTRTSSYHDEMPTNADFVASQGSGYYTY
ncbi:serine/threonine-protein phosphatase 6 regulatory ankyrin repeat subunit B [Capsella rubella]|uniref:serine/threonine-protein phosphatase 6 regulatory ankyrin repeat subunit B n=1 Tax=Capsella rubella TaxID=81985 RepID=UPI000CD5035C|nr:serine/threonine-protein phosphatase 6 regulatory ankyrin repeat subunit B [Capsella rubella]